MHLGAPGVSEPAPLLREGSLLLSSTFTWTIDYSVKFDKIHLEIISEWMYSINDLFIMNHFHIGRKDMGKIPLYSYPIDVNLSLEMDDTAQSMC